MIISIELKLCCTIDIYCGASGKKMFLVLKYHTRLNDDELYRDTDLNKTILVSVNPEEHQRNLEAAEQWKMSHDPNQATFDAPLLGK